MRDLLPPFKILREDIENEDALREFSESLNTYLSILLPDRIAANYQDIGGDPSAPST